MKKLLLLLSFVLLVPLGSSHALFNSELAYNPNYRPVHYGQYIETYVDLTSIVTKKNTDRQWIFAVNLFASQEDSGIIGKTFTQYYKINKKTREAWVKQRGDWKRIPMDQYPAHFQQGHYNTINFCYAWMFGRYLYDYNGATSKWANIHYKG